MTGFSETLNLVCDPCWIRDNDLVQPVGTQHAFRVEKREGTQSADENSAVTACESLYQYRLWKTCAKLAPNLRNFAARFVGLFVRMLFRSPQQDEDLLLACQGHPLPTVT